MKLEIPEPCQENWNNFAKTEKGGFCGSCVKEVIDFTMLSDGEIKKYFLSLKTSKVCGRFNEEQLNRNIVATRTGNYLLLKASSIAIGFTAYFASISIKAQTDVNIAPSPDTIVHTISIEKPVSKQQELSSITGTVLVLEPITQPTLPNLDFSQLLSGRVGGVSLRRNLFERAWWRIKSLFQ